MLFLEILDGTILVTAIPAIAADLGVRTVDVSVVLVAYLVSPAACMPPPRWLTHRYGVRRTLLWSIAGFTLASGVCAVAPNLTVLVAARVAQGIAGSLIVPAGRLAVVRGTDAEDLLDAIAYLTWPALVAPVVAPLLGGVLADTVGWRWIFLVNVPLGVLAFIAGLLVLPRGTERPPGRFDTGGFLGVMVAMVAVTAAAELLTSGRQGHVPAAGIAVFVLVGGVTGWMAVRHMKRVATPLFALDVMSVPTFRVGNLSGSVYRLIITAAPFLFTLLFQVRFGWSATAAGAAVVALFLGNVAVKPFTSPIIRRWGFRNVLVFSNLVGGLVLLAAVALSADTPPAVIVALLIVSGILRSVGFSAYNTLQFVDIAEDGTANANVLSATLHQLATSLGVAAAVLFIHLVGHQWAFALAAALFLFPLSGALALGRDAGAKALAHTRQ